jgi:hypothetical protein
LGDETDLQRPMWVDGFTEEDQREREARESILTEIGHDRRGRKASAHLGEREAGVFGYESEIA